MFKLSKEVYPIIGEYFSLVVVVDNNEVIKIHKYTYHLSYTGVFLFLGKDVKSVEHRKFSGSSMLITSTHFPSYSNLDGTIYNFTFVNRDKNAYVRVVFTDFNIHPSSVVKV